MEQTIDYHGWLHELTTIMYDHGVIIGVESAELIKGFYDEGKSVTDVETLLMEEIANG